MAENSAIEWTDHTWSPLWGCTQVSKAETGGGGCDNCYAQALSHRFGYGWNGEPGASGQIWREFGEHHWNEPVRWNRRAEKYGTKPKVFPSMCDPFDKDWPAGVRCRFFRLIKDTPNLTWLLLTKRIGNAHGMVEELRREAINAMPTDKEMYRWLDDWVDGKAPANVWLGATVVNQVEADRDIPKLLATPARVRFLSIEPMLGPIDLTEHLWGRAVPCVDCPRDADCPCGWSPRSGLSGQAALHWVICGGESGPKARPSHPDWFRSLRDQCAAAGVPFLHKQNGEFAPIQTTSAEFLRPALGREGERIAEPDGKFSSFPSTEHCVVMRRVGKKAAGRTLDGVTHDGFPA